MKTIIILSVILVIAHAKPVEVERSADELGNYVFGFNDGVTAHKQSRSADGIVIGAYTYIDSNNQIQKVEYTADAVNGFQARGTNFPVAEGRDLKEAIPKMDIMVVVKDDVEPKIKDDIVVTVKDDVKLTVKDDVVKKMEKIPIESDVVEIKPIEVKSSEMKIVEIMPTMVQPIELKSEVDLKPVEKKPVIEAKSIELRTLESIEKPLVLTSQKPVTDTPEVVAARKSHLIAIEQAKVRNAAVESLDIPEQILISSFN